MKPFDPGNDWLKFWNENQKSLFQAWAEGKPPPFAFRGEPPPSGDASRQSALMSELMSRSMEEWAQYAKKAWSQGDRFDAESMKHLFDPAEWKRAGSQFDMGLEKLVEGPTYATLWDLDKKMLNVQKLWMDRAKDVEKYWEVVQGAWNNALARFMKTLNDPKGEPITSGRQMLDAWLATANAALIEMHRSRDFLEAQRKVTPSSTEDRLPERAIAQAFRQMHRIPTRTDMDATQMAVTERRRELPAMKREPDAPKARAQRARR